MLENKGKESGSPQVPDVVTKVTIGNEFIDQYGHVNYKRFPDIFEKGQDDLMERAGINFDQIEAQYGLRSFVITMTPTYKGQVKTGDEVALHTVISRIGNTSIAYSQKMEMVAIEVAAFQLVVVLVNSEGKPTRIPDDLREKLKPYDIGEEDLLNQPIEVLGLTDRVRNVLARDKSFWNSRMNRSETSFRTVGDIDRLSDEVLDKIPHMGNKSIKEIREKIATYKARNG